MKRRKREIRGGAAVGGAGGAATGFLLDLATRAFSKDIKTKKKRAELFMRIAQKLDPDIEIWWQSY